MFIHFQFEKFKPRYIGTYQDGKIVQISFMVPNIHFLYFYTLDYKIVLNKTESVQLRQELFLDLDFKIKKISCYQ